MAWASQDQARAMACWQRDLPRQQHLQQRPASYRSSLPRLVSIPCLRWWSSPLPWQHEATDGQHAAKHGKLAVQKRLAPSPRRWTRSHSRRCLARGICITRASPSHAVHACRPSCLHTREHSNARARRRSRAIYVHLYIGYIYRYTRPGWVLARALTQRRPLRPQPWFCYPSGPNAWCRSACSIVRGNSGDSGRRGCKTRFRPWNGRAATRVGYILKRVGANAGVVGPEGWRTCNAAAWARPPTCAQHTGECKGSQLAQLA